MKRSRVLQIIVAFLITGNALAGYVENAKVVKVRVDSNGAAIVFFDKTMSSSPTCIHPYYAKAIAIDTNTAGGKSFLSLALSAHATDASVSAWGKGVCGIYGGSVVESLSQGHIN